MITRLKCSDCGCARFLMTSSALVEIRVDEDGEMEDVLLGAVKPDADPQYYCEKCHTCVTDMDCDEEPIEDE